ncbi:MAG: UDP-glucose 4-epimerase GalE [Anaerolineaceae bacterium]|nr:UDP-glucose 4-epimerase GalE [Anaerolineaceae bacterium]
MNILVAGGAGYIGSVTTRQLLDAGHQVTVYDSLVKGYAAAIPDRANFIQGDILDSAALGHVLSIEAYDAILHFAAFIEAGESMTDPGKFFRNNVTGSINLIEAAAAHAVPRFVFSSSAGVYASKNSPLVESDPIGPASVYGQTKCMVEETLEWYHRVKGLRFAALRYFNAAGATPPARGEAHRPESHLIPLVLQVALGQRENIAIFGDDYPTPDGTCIRDYIHITDLAAAHLLALKALDERPRMVYNLGNSTGYSVKEVIETARQVTGHEIPAVSKPRRPGDAAILVGDTSQIRRDLGWIPQTPDLKTIISSAWEWHHTHPRGYNA